jgi:hypothetical protein
MARVVSVQEISKHNISEDLWTVVDGTVYDLTEFAPEHPGGAGSEPPPLESQEPPPSTPSLPFLTSASNHPLRWPRCLFRIQRNSRPLSHKELSPLLQDHRHPRSLLHNRRMGKTPTYSLNILLSRL